MTDELTKTFFDTFGIEPIACNDCIECYEANTTPFPWCEKLDYPQITDRILLELICILATYLKNIECCHLVIADNIETLKRHTLNDCMDYVKDIKHQVRTLFEEG